MRSATPSASAPPEPPSPMTVAMIGHRQARHDLEVLGDGLGLAALLGVDAGIGAGRVDEGEDGQPEPRRQLHQAPRLAVALGARHAEVAPHVLLGAAPLLVADDHHRPPAEAPHAADDRLVVAEGAIAVQLDEVLEQAADVIERERAQRMARQQHLLPRRQLGEDLALQLARLALEPADLELELRRRRADLSSAILFSSSTIGRSKSSAWRVSIMGGTPRL